MKYTTSILLLSLTLLTACNAGGVNSSDTSSNDYPSYAPRKDPAQEIQEMNESWARKNYEDSEKQFKEWDKKNGVPHVPMPCVGCGN